MGIWSVQIYHISGESSSGVTVRDEDRVNGDGRLVGKLNFQSKCTRTIYSDRMSTASSSNKCTSSCLLPNVLHSTS